MRNWPCFLLLNVTLPVIFISKTPPGLSGTCNGISFFRKNLLFLEVANINPKKFQNKKDLHLVSLPYLWKSRVHCLPFKYVDTHTHAGIAHPYTYSTAVTHSNRRSHSYKHSPMSVIYTNCGRWECHTTHTHKRIWACTRTRTSRHKHSHTDTHTRSSAQ